MSNSYFQLLSKFISIGLVATAIHALIYALMIHFFEKDPQLSNLAGYLVAVSFSYYFQMKWTFSHRNNDVGLKSLSKFIVASLLGFAINAIFVFIVDDLLLINSLYALICIIFMTPAITFLLLNFWVFPSNQNEK